MPGERVAVASHNCARLLGSFFGVAGHGRVLVPINFRLSTDEVAYIVEDSGASLLLVDPDLQDRLKGVSCDRTIVLGEQGDQEMYRFDAEPAALAQREPGSPRGPPRNHSCGAH